jgi:ubiquitin-conjugating enzyme E2 D/E
MSTPSRTFPASATRRLQKEYRNLRDNPIEGCTATLNDPSNLFSWKATIQGPPETPYESGIFHLSLEFPETYPLHPPIVTFTTKVYHPNIDSHNGFICVNILQQDWCSVLTISTILLSLRSFLHSPDAEDAYYPTMGEEYVERRDVFDEKARKFTEEFARGEE